MPRFLTITLVTLLLAAPCGAAELVLPQNRTAFYSAERIELAVAGLKKDEKAKLESVPATKGLKTLSFDVVGDGDSPMTSHPT
jgi:hypothetical protein